MQGCRRRHHEGTSKCTTPTNNNAVNTEFCDGTVNRKTPSDSLHVSNNDVKDKKGNQASSNSIRPIQQGRVVHTAPSEVTAAPRIVPVTNPGQSAPASSAYAPSIDRTATTVIIADGAAKHVKASENVQNQTRSNNENNNSTQHGHICTVTFEKKKEAYRFVPVANTSNLEPIHKSKIDGISSPIHVDVSAATVASNAIPEQSVSEDCSNVFPNYISVTDPAQSLEYIKSLEKISDLAKSIDKALQELPASNSRLPKNLDEAKKQLGSKKMCESAAKIMNAIINKEWDAYVKNKRNALTDDGSIVFSVLLAFWIERSTSAE